MIQFKNIAELVALADAGQTTVGEVVLAWEAERSGRSREEIRAGMAEVLATMRAAAAQGLTGERRSYSGLVGGDARRLVQWRQTGRALCGDLLLRVVSSALAVSEVNASMGRIVAAPTAGSCGIIPGALLPVAEARRSGEAELINALFTTAGIGACIAAQASLSGAEGGCQAECGSAAGMAAGALVELAGGAPAQVKEAVALALKNTLGWTCDPVAGLVEVPCVKRNAMGAALAIVAADMALAGIRSVIPADEVIQAAREIGRMLPPELKETAGGGLACTPTAKEIAAKLYGG